MKKTILIINIIAFTLSIIWVFQSNYQLEPLIVAFTLLATLIGIVFIEPAINSLNRSKIKGNNNKVAQKTTEKSNYSKIEGNSNEVNQ